MLAAFENQIQVLESLHKYDSLNTSSSGEGKEEPVDQNGNTALHYAAWGGSLECVQYLVEVCGKRCDVVNHDSILPLQFAAAGNFTAIVQFLAGRSAASDKEDCSISGLSTLHRAAAYGSLDTMRILLEQQSYDLNLKTANGSTALHLASQHGHFSVVAYLLERVGVQIDEGNDYGLTALHYACIG